QHPTGKSLRPALSGLYRGLSALQHLSILDTYERCPYHNDKGRIMADRQQIAPQPGTWEALPFLSTESEYRHQFVVWAFALIFVCLSGAVVIYPVWNVGYPWGSDSWGHLHRAEHMAQIIQSEGIVQGFF